MNGKLRLTPKLDTGPFESNLVSRDIRIDKGLWLEEGK